MAKKKTVSASKTRSAAKKSKARKSPVKTKATAKRATAKRAASKAKVAKKPATQTVDGILKSFEKERVTKNRALTSTRKKIESLTKEIASIKAELEGLKKTVFETEIAIETLDTRRDAEVGALLSGMGIDLARAAAALAQKETVEKDTPLFDAPADAKQDNLSVKVDVV